MAKELLKRDDNHVPVMGGVTNDASEDVRQVKMDPLTDEILTSLGSITTVTNEGVTSLSTVPGNFDVEVVHLDAEDVVLTEGFMLIDLSDTTNWPHTNTGHIDLLFMILTTDPTNTFSGDIAIGFLTNVDGDNGDFNEIFEIHMEKKPEPDIFNINYGAFGIALETDHVFGPITANDTTWQTDVNLQGPDGATSFPSGNGDMVMLVTRGAGDVSVSITVGYRTIA